MTRSGRSLLQTLFVSIVILTSILLVASQAVGIVGPAEDAASFGRLMLTNDWLGEMGRAGPYALAMVLTTTGSIWLTLHLALRPMRRLSDRAGAIDTHNLHQRLPVEAAPAEIAPLVRAFNLSLDRLETAWALQRAFSANAAHELRMPLASLRAHLESLLPAEERAVATAEFDRLARLIEQLLYLAEADQDHLSHRAAFDLEALAREAAALIAPAVVASGRSLDFVSEGGCVLLKGDPVLAGVAIRNLLENAARHTPAGAKIRVVVRHSGALIVSDDGPGVPLRFERRLFDRFAKSDAGGPGAGLGLSIVARIMALHRGSVRYARLADGSAFHLEFGSGSTD